MNEIKMKKTVPVAPAHPVAKQAKRKAAKGLSDTAEEAAEPAGMPEDEANEEMLRQGKYDTETLLQAHDIKNNPDKMKAVKAHIKNHMSKIGSIADLKNLYDAKYGSGKKK